MLPLINTTLTSVTPQPSLVATPVPESNTLRVPPTAVAPPVSSAQIDPNASGNNQLLPQTTGTPSSPSAAIAQSLVVTANNLSPGAPIGAPATLLAQMIGQNLPPEAQNMLRGVLNEYEKIIVNSYVKYKPSNASLPRAEPAGAFSQMLKQITSPAQEKPAPVRAASPANTAQTETDVDDTVQEATVVDAAPAAVKPAYKAFNAYAVAAARLPSTGGNVADSVDETKVASE